MRYALREEDFGPVLGAGGFLILTGTVAYSLGNGWDVIDSLYFAVATLTTSSIADPDLVLVDAWMKLFTVLYVPDRHRHLGGDREALWDGFIAVRREDKAAGGESPTG